MSTLKRGQPLGLTLAELAVAIALLIMILMYEGAAWAIGWTLGYLDALTERPSPLP